MKKWTQQKFFYAINFELISSGEPNAEIENDAKTRVKNFQNRKEEDLTRREGFSLVYAAASLLKSTNLRQDDGVGVKVSPVCK